MTQTDFINEDHTLPAKAAALSQESLKPLKEAKDAFEKDYLTYILQLCGGSVGKAAKLAGKYRADFYDLLKKHDLKAGDFKKSE